MSTLMLSFGTPIIRSGDEFLNTQFGNNNTYCQDNVISYLVWETIGGAEVNNIRFVKELIRLRRKMSVFNRKNFFYGSYIDDKLGIKDIAWYTEKGTEFTQADWGQHSRKMLSYMVAAQDRMYMVIFNANANNIKWKLPNLKKGYKWTLLLDSSDKFEAQKIASGAEIWVPAWEVLCFEIKK